MLVAHALATPLKVFNGDFTGGRTQNYIFHVKVTQWMKAPSLLFLALYGKVPSLDGAYAVTDIINQMPKVIDAEDEVGIGTKSTSFSINMLFYSPKELGVDLLERFW
jgi:hypothetical protein